MSEFEVVAAFLSHTESVDTDNDFKQYWSQMWKPITQQCLIVAKNQFILKKSLEMFKGKIILFEFGDKEYKWSDIFVHEEEVNVLRTLCEHVGLNMDEFMYYGFDKHKTSCQKYFKKKRAQRASKLSKLL